MVLGDPAVEPQRARLRIRAVAQAQTARQDQGVVRGIDRQPVILLAEKAVEEIGEIRARRAFPVLELLSQMRSGPFGHGGHSWAKVVR